MDNELICKRCGILVVLPKNKRTQPNFYCTGCRARPAKTCRYGDEVCIPWPYDFDENDHPLKDGQPYLPGKRTCGHSDCVNGLHILSEE